jgi:uncharacterized protein (DUF1697 family)
MTFEPNSHLALLRGVNIVRAQRVAMSDLRTLFEGLGFHDVRTLLNSGNVVFSMPAKGRGDLATRIEKAIASKLGLSVSVTVLSTDEVATAVRENPLARIATDLSHLLVFAPQAATDLTHLKPLLKQRWTPEVLAIGARVAYLWCPKGLAKSPLWTATDRATDKTGTARNIATFTKILALMEKLPQ